MTVISILRKPEVELKTGLSGSSIDRQEKSGDFPQRMKLTEGGAVGWLSTEINDWVLNRPRGVLDPTLTPEQQVKSIQAQLKARAS